MPSFMAGLVRPRAMPPGRTRWGNTRAGPVQSGRRRGAGVTPGVRPTRATAKRGVAGGVAGGHRGAVRPQHRPAPRPEVERRGPAGHGPARELVQLPPSSRWEPGGADAVFDAGREERSRRHLRHHAQLPLAAEQTWCPGRRHGLPATTRTSPQSSVPDLALDSAAAHRHGDTTTSGGSPRRDGAASRVRGSWPPWVHAMRGRPQCATDREDGRQE